MKRIISNVMLVAAAATAFFSCQKQEMVTSEAAKEVTLTFASEKPAFDDETKTEWTGSTIKWSKGDQIAIAYTVDGEWMGATNQQSGTLMGTKLYKSTALTAAAETAQFNVNSSFNIVKEGEHVFYGVYPAPQATDFPNAPVASLEIPAVQTPAASSFDPSADLMTAISVDKFASLPGKDEKISLRWTRLVAHANITLKDIKGAVAGEKVLSVKLTAQEGANLVGKQKVNILTNEVENNDETANVLELSGSALSVAEGGNVEFWACVLPETLTSLTVVLDTDKATYTREITGISKTFKKNARNILAINMADAKRDEKVVVPEDKTVTGTLTFDSDSKRIVSTTTQQVWSENDITLTYDKAGYNNNLAEYENPVRFYANTTITIEAPGNIQSIEFACNTTSYATALQKSISGSSVNDKIVNVTLDASSSSVTYQMTAQVRMDALTVTYVKSDGSDIPDSAPKLEIDETEIEISAEETNGTINVTAENIESIEVRSLVEEGSQEEVEWLTVEYANDVISYSAAANESEDPRTACIEVYALDTEDNELVKYIAVTQKGYVDPSVIEDVTVEEFKEASVNPEKYYQLTGTISSIKNDTYGNIDLQDETGTIYIYGLTKTKKTGANSNDKSFPTLGLKVGDKVTLCTVRGEYEGEPQGGGSATPAYLVSAEKLAAWDAPVIACVNNKVTVTAEEGVEIRYTSDGTEPTSSSTLYTGEFDITTSVTIKAIAIADGRPSSNVAEKLCEYVEESQQPSTTTATLSFANKAQRTSFSTTQQVWEQNGIMFTNDKSSSTTAVADYANPVRLYANSKVTVTAPDNTITEIIFDCNSSSYATALKNSIGTVSGASVTVSSDKVTVTFTSAVESFVVAKLTAQVRMDSITVTYQN